MLDHYIRSCHVITHNTCKTWGLIYSCAMRTFIAWHTHAGKLATLCICGMPGITYGCAVRASQTIFIKINCLTFWHPKYKICEPECAGKDSHCHAQQEQGQLR